MGSSSGHENLGALGFSLDVCTLSDSTEEGNSKRPKLSNRSFGGLRFEMIGVGERSFSFCVASIMSDRDGRNAGNLVCIVLFAKFVLTSSFVTFEEQKISQSTLRLDSTDTSDNLFFLSVIEKRKFGTIVFRLHF